MNKKTGLIGGGLAVVLLLGVGVWYFLLRDDAPDEVSTEAGLEQLREDLAEEEGGDAPAAEDNAAEVDAAEEDPDDSAPEDSAPEDTTTDEPETDEPETTEPEAVAGPVDGEWIVDDEFGDFGFDNPSGSFAGFRVNEEFPTGPVDAVGRTGGVTGSITIAGDALTAGSVTVDMTQMESDVAPRADVIKDTIDASGFPEGTFVVTGDAAIDGAALAAGDTVTVEVTGDLTIKGTTQSVVVPIEATIAAEGTALLVGSVDLVWSDFGVDTPSTPLAEIADEGVLEFQLVVRQG